MDLKAIIKRTVNIIVRPNEEWQVISQEVTSKNAVLSGYAIPYIIVVAIASVAGNYLFGFDFFSFNYILFSAVISFIVPFFGIFISAYIINALAPSFGSVSNINNSFKLVIYSYTASFLASIITGFLPILFFIGIAGLYSFYIFWLGFGPMMKTPDDKKAGYAILSILIIIGVYGVLSISLGLILATFFVTGAAFQI